MNTNSDNRILFLTITINPSFNIIREINFFGGNYRKDGLVCQGNLGHKMWCAVSMFIRRK